MLAYLHIPFCHRVCPYCSFYKHTPGATPIRAFIDAVAVEATHRFLTQENPRTLYLGGGTPSMLSPSHLSRLFSTLRQTIDFSRLEEVTLEANPATFDLAKARLFRDLGVTRVSLGVQSFSPGLLKVLGREHTPAQAAASVEVLREAGVPAINIDLMFSIPGQSETEWEETLREAVALEPDHVSAYNLTYEEDTLFFESLRRGEVTTSEDIDARMFHMGDAFLTAAGYAHYETSNYARAGCESVHNQGYWSGEDYLGLGPSAVSTLGSQRLKNASDTAFYVDQVQAVGHAVIDIEALDEAAKRIERIALGLRTSAGIQLDLLDDAGRARAADLVAEGYARFMGERLVLVQHGRALVDPIAAELL